MGESVSLWDEAALDLEPLGLELPALVLLLDPAEGEGAGAAAAAGLAFFDEDEDDFLFFLGSGGGGLGLGEGPGAGAAAMADDALLAWCIRWMAASLKVSWAEVTRKSSSSILE